MRRLVARAVAAMLLASALAGCDISTATAPTGDLTLYAPFDDVEDLTAGHNVQSANVVIGSVRDVELDGYRARVELSIVDGREVPAETSAIIRHTSVLGEAFVDLVFPEQFDAEHGPFLTDGDEITDTDTEDGVEQLAAEAAGLVDALAGTDVAAIVESGALALGGRGETINQLVRDTGTFADTLADQRAQLETVIDNLAAIGDQVAPAAGGIADLIGEVSTTTESLASSRERMVETVRALVGLAATTNERVLVPHSDRILQLLGELNPLMSFLAERSDTLEELITHLLRFTETLPQAIYSEQVLLLTWAFIDLESLGSGSQLSDLLPLDAMAELVQRSAR